MAEHRIIYHYMPQRLTWQFFENVWLHAFLRPGWVSQGLGCLQISDAPSSYALGSAELTCRSGCTAALSGMIDRLLEGLDTPS